MGTKKTKMMIAIIEAYTEDSNLPGLEKKLVLHFNCQEEAVQ
jgi:hypothetical protein